MEIHNPNCFLTKRKEKLDLYAYEAIIDVEVKEITPTGRCPSCEGDVYGTKYCSSECSAIGNRKVRKRPSKDSLKKMMSEMSMVAIGDKYGVSDNAIRKWAKQYKLLSL